MSERWEERTDRVEIYFWDGPAGEMVNRDLRRCWSWSRWRRRTQWSTWGKVIKNVQNLRHSKSFERGDGAGGDQEEGGGHQHQRTPSSLLSSTAFQIRWQSPSFLLIRLICDLCFTFLQCCLPCVCYYTTGFCCAQSMDPICGCVTLFKARAPSDRKVRRQWQLLTVPKHSAQNLTPRIRLNISTSNFSPTL